MRIGLAMPQFGSAAATSADEVARFAREAEALGAGSLWAADRLLAATRPVVGYLGSDTIPRRFRAVLDPFLILATAAAVTSRPLLGFCVLNAPFYSPAILARQLTTLDLLSGGRLIPGFGVGWSPEEYAAAGVPMRERGARLEETLDVLDALWTRNPAAHHGEFFDIPECHADLKPVQRPAPPVYLAGFAPAALDRVARRAAGWLPVAVVPGGMDAAAISRLHGRIRARATALGRPAPDAILRINTLPSATVADIRAALQVAEQDCGITHVLIELNSRAATTAEALTLAAAILD